MKIQLKNKRKLNIEIDSLHIECELNRLDHPVLPSRVYIDGYMSWQKSSFLHREGKPAVIREDGTKYYWENGKLIKEEN